MQIFRNIFVILRVAEFAGLSLVICDLIQFCDPCSRMNQNEHICTVLLRAIQMASSGMAHRNPPGTWSTFSPQPSPVTISHGSLGHNMSDFSQMVEISSHNKYQPHHKNSGCN